MYVLVLEEFARVALAHVQAAAFARALGSSVEVPSWWDMRIRFDETLCAEPEQIDPAKAVMMDALGLRR